MVERLVGRLRSGSAILVDVCNSGAVFRGVRLSWSWRLVWCMVLLVQGVAVVSRFGGTAGVHGCTMHARRTAIAAS